MCSPLSLLQKWQAANMVSLSDENRITFRRCTDEVSVVAKFCAVVREVNPNVTCITHYSDCSPHTFHLFNKNTFFKLLLLTIYDNLHMSLNTVTLSSQKTSVINPLKTKRICFIQGLSAYRAVNTLHYGYKNQSLNVL
jgi:hypothetical protein